MIRYLTPRPVSHNSWTRFLTYPDPDALLLLGMRGDVRDNAVPAEDFSRVVSSIRIGHMHKLTGSKRLCQVDHHLGEQLSSLRKPAVAFLDVGGSDGVTTLDTVRLLRERLGVEVSACLLELYVRLIRYQRGWIREFRAPDGSPVMVCLGRIGLQLSSLSSSRDPLSRALGAIYMSRDRFRTNMEKSGEISLIHPLAAAEPGIRVLEGDALQRQPELVAGFDAVRATNILNLGYFPAEQIKGAISHLHAYLHEGGFLAISRNKVEKSGEVEHGSIWRRLGPRFVRIADWGNGSEVAALVDRHEHVVLDDPESR